MSQLARTAFTVTQKDGSGGEGWANVLHVVAGEERGRGISAGIGYSTVRDLLAFAMALQQHKLLDLNSRRGRIEGMEMVGGTQAIKATVPLSTMFG